MTPKQREIQRKRRVLEYAEQIGNSTTFVCIPVAAE